MASSPSRYSGSLARGAKEIEETTMAKQHGTPASISLVTRTGHGLLCSALAYAWLKNRGSLTGLYEARRAGHVNRETRFVLQHFGVEAPRLYCTDVSPQIKGTSTSASRPALTAK